MKKLKRHKSSSGFSIDVKRFYAPYTIEWECEECGSKHKDNFAEDYLSYPNIGEQDYVLYCDECDHEEMINLSVDVKLKIVE